MSEKIQGNNMIPNMVIVLFSIIETLKYFDFVSVENVNAFGVLMGVFSIMYIFFTKHVRRKSVVIIFFVLYTICGLLSCFINGNIDLQELLWPLFFMGISLILLETKPSSRAARIAFYIFSITAIIFIMSAGGKIYNLSTAESRNYCSVYALCFLSIYIITLAKEGSAKLPLLEVIVNMIVSMLSLGRGGIITSILLVVFTLWNEYKYFFDLVKNGKNKIKLKTLMIFVLICSTIIAFSQSDYCEAMLSYFIFSAEYFDERGLHGSRGDIWEDYLDIIISTPLSILFAPKISGSNLLNMYSFNLHNSYLMLYARYGSIVFGWVIILLIKSLKKFYKYNQMLLCITFVIMVRIFTDVVSFNGVMDVPLYFLLFVTPQTLKKYR